MGSDVNPWAFEGFGRAADAYERARPDYPAAALEWLAERLDLRPGRVVVDVGAGTGKLSRLLAATGARVLAVEPLAEMRRLLEGTPGVEPLSAPAEALPLPDASADAVTAGQAFHWFRGDEALAEMHRILRPASGVALLWNRLDRDDSVAGAFAALIDRYRGHPSLEEGDRWRQPFSRTDFFGPLERRVFDNAHDVDGETLAARAASESSIAILPEEPRAELLAEVRALAPEPVALRYFTEVFTCSRKP
jgi:SAM-dependent methyltransferase